MIVGMMLAANMAAQACDCAPPPPADKAFAGAAAVFVGTVQQVQRDEQSRDKIVTLTVEQAWKGLAADQKTVTVSTCASGACCGYGFQEKEGYLVYARGEGKSLSVSLCSRTRPLANADKDIVVLNQVVAGTYVPPPTPPPPPRPEVAKGVDAGNGVTVGLQDNGLVVAAVHTSGRTMWQVKLAAPASAVQVDGNRVIMQPSGLVLDLASGKIIEKP